ncbi:hypothetical protein [Streptomyces sp. CJ_13]|uniref:hypothetical protein n=1 Tax=Streptomyces sp. CJ_13 TaxID=2724943 RepID=UPI002029F5CE|nr:hypothetical protein [Streptomyces sp. CJ_13]
MRTLLNDAASEARESLLTHARRVDSSGRTRTLKERWRADRFWTIENGTVDHDMHSMGTRPRLSIPRPPGSCSAGPGWSRPASGTSAPPPPTRSGPSKSTPTAVRELCKEDSAVGRAASIAVAAVMAQDLPSARTRILALFAPHGSGQPLAHAR